MALNTQKNFTLDFHQEERLQLTSSLFAVTLEDIYTTNRNLLKFMNICLSTYLKTVLLSHWLL